MKEPEQHFSSESIDQQTESVFGQLPTQDSRLIADLYQTYTPSREEHSRSLQRIWSRLAQEQEQYSPPQEGRSTHLSRSTRLSKEIKDVNARRPDAPVPGSFQRRPQPLPRGLRRSLWRRLSGGVAVAVVLIIILSWVLLTHTFPMENPRTTSGASLTLGEAPQLNNTIVFLVKSSEGGQDLATISYDTYDGHTWSNTPVSRSLPANKRLSSEGSPVHMVTQQITLINPAGEQQPYIFGAGQIASVDLPTTVLINKTTGSLIAVLLNNGQPLAAGERYTVQSYVSSADIMELRTIPLPADAPQLPHNYNGQLPSTYYNPAILSAYLRLPKIDPRVKDLAQQLTAGAHTMADKAIALENYFRTSFTYSTTIHLLPGAEATAWLLFQSNHSAFCNYFASAMAVMARELGMPARVVIGYTAGTFDAKTHDWVVHGSDAHAWTQIYFAGYGWINFEPSPGFSQFPRPL